MRESSVTLPSSSGTLKSTRTKTRFPDASRSRTVSLSTAAGPGAMGGSGAGDRRRPLGAPQALRDEPDEVGHAAAVTPFVVVPGDDLHHRPAEDHRRGGVDDRTALVAPEVRAHQGLVGHAEDALHRALGRGPERVVELVDRG